MNDFIFYENYIEIVLRNIQGKETGRTKIDIEDYDRVKAYKWHKSHGYPKTYLNGKKIYLSRFIMNAPSNMVVDHINHDPLDNRKCNLRLCTQGDNMANRKVQKNNSSGVTGVTWHSRTNKWRAYINKNHKKIYLGYYNDFDKAVEARKQAEKKYFGEYRNIT